MDITDVLVREFTENLLFLEEIYGKMFLQVAEGLAQTFLARNIRAQSFLFMRSASLRQQCFYLLFIIYCYANFDEMNLC